MMRIMTKRPKRFSDQLREVVKTCGLTRYRITKETGVNETTLWRFVHGKGGLSTDSLDRIAELLHLEVTMKGPASATDAQAKAGGTKRPRRKANRR